MNLKRRDLREKTTKRFKKFLTFEKIFQNNLERNYVNVTYKDVKAMTHLFNLRYKQVKNLLRGKLTKSELKEIDEERSKSMDMFTVTLNVPADFVNIRGIQTISANDTAPINRVTYDDDMGG